MGHLFHGYVSHNQRVVVLASTTLVASHCGNPLFGLPLRRSVADPVNFHIRPAGCPAKSLGDRAMMWDFNSCDGVLGYNQNNMINHGISWYHIKTNAPTSSTRRICLFFSLHQNVGVSIIGGTPLSLHVFFSLENPSWWMMTGGTRWLRKPPYHTPW